MVYVYIFEMWILQAAILVRVCACVLIRGYIYVKFSSIIWWF